jgi:hypothetical protein
MSCRSEKALADVATDMVGGETPPEWLTRALMELARTVATIGSWEERDPLCKEVRSRFLRVQAAASEMDRALNGILRDGWLWIQSRHIDDFPGIRQALRKAVEMSDRALKSIPSGGRRRARQLTGPTARVVCAIVVIEAWTALHGKPRGGHNDSIGEICEKYWRACGGDRTGSGDPGNWRRRMKEALADQSALRRYVHSELHRWTGQNPPENIGNSVP